MMAMQLRRARRDRAVVAVFTHTGAPGPVRSSILVISAKHDHRRTVSRRWPYG